MNPEAIEAAAKVLHDRWDSGECLTPEDEARAALEAAAPYLIREARAAELEAAAEKYGSGQLTGLFLRRDGYPKAWLRARAAAIRAGEA